MKYKFFDDQIQTHLKYTYRYHLFSRFDKNDEKTKFFYAVNFAEYLKFSDEWICDGTLLFCPVESFQLYIIYGRYLNNTCPWLYAILNYKKETTYSELFNNIKQIICNTNPRYLIIDNEKSVYNAFKLIFTNTGMFFCLRHFLIQSTGIY